MAIDSAGFTELKAHGCWTIDDQQLADVVARVMDAGTMVDFAAPRDWMCEPFILAKTGKTILEHQQRTIESYVTLKRLAPGVAWMPVLQGWEPEDYERHALMYEAAGVRLKDLPRVGVGSVCRRQGTKDGARIMNRCADLGIRCHAFGIKTEGLKLFGHRIASADSMTWSFIARRRGLILDVCEHENAHEPSRRASKNCANCLRWALEWRRTRILKLPRTYGSRSTRAGGGRGEATVRRRTQLDLPFALVTP